MSVKQAQKNKRRQARKKAKTKPAKPYSPAPSQNLIEGVRPRLIAYIQSKQQYLDIFTSLERGQVYLVATEGPHTQHMLISEQEYLGMMPKEDRGPLSAQFALLTTEKVVGYTEDDTGFMTYFLADDEVLYCV